MRIHYFHWGAFARDVPGARNKAEFLGVWRRGLGQVEGDSGTLWTPDTGRVADLCRGHGGEAGEQGACSLNAGGAGGYGDQLRDGGSVRAATGERRWERSRGIESKVLPPRGMRAASGEASA